MDGVTEWKEYRNYEVSVWTLQDSYITTLKSGDSIYVASQPALAWPQARAQGQIQNGKMVLNIDGTQTLNFDIPMYLFYNGQRIENPNWYNIVNKNILTSMRKIKVIFDKWEDVNKSDNTFEFMIVKVQETHESDELMCHVECEGLAFNELGKVGYKKSLSTQEFLNEEYAWSETKDSDYNSPDTKENHRPVNNLQYWMSKTGIEYLPTNADDINPTKWYYEIKMYYSSLDYDINITSDKIYEGSYVSDWSSAGIPLNYVGAQEKYRLVDISESNLYNITQELAEKFEVFCRYRYLYDTNYNIIGRVITFYNNFLQENAGVTTLMYPNSASKISREMDSTDVSTKMFVRQVESAELYDGIISIMDCSANKMREDYILNFDYLHDIGTISDEQYAAVSEFELAIREINNKLIPLQDIYNNLSSVKIDNDAQITLLNNSITLDQEQIQTTNDLLQALDLTDAEQDGYITRGQNNPDLLYLTKEDKNSKYKNSYYVSFDQDEKLGVDLKSVRLYKTRNSFNTHEYSYGLSFKKFSVPTTSKIIDSIVPGTNTGSDPASGVGWVNYEFVYKGTIGSTGDKADVNSLPTVGTANKGWVYKVITAGTYTFKKGGQSTSISNCVIGDLLYQAGSSNGGWTRLQLSGKSKNGFYIYKRDTIKQLNGLQTNIYTCTRYGASNSSIDFISKLRYVYYTQSPSDNNNPPATPIISNVKTKETVIEKGNVLNAWSEYISTPDSLNDCNIYDSKELTYFSGKRVFLDTRKINKSYSYYGENTSINDLFANNKNVLTDEITNGKFLYKQKRITNLFKNKTPDNTYVYATYRYKPSLYYTELLDEWNTKLQKDQRDLGKQNIRHNKLETLLAEAKQNISDCLAEKEEIIAKFEHMMGAALRESYWQPENEYQDHGKRYIESFNLSNNNINTPYAIFRKNNSFAYIGWDGNIFSEEDELYYTTGVNEVQTYYPCIDLSKLTTTKSGATSNFLSLLAAQLNNTSRNPQENYSFFYNPASTIIPDNANPQDVRYCKQFVIGSGAKLAFARCDGNIKPILILADAENLPDDELTNLIATGCIGQLNLVTDSSDDYILQYDESKTFVVRDTNNAWLTIDNNTNIVYPRILIPSLKLKTDTNDLVIQLDDISLIKYNEYSINEKTYYIASGNSEQYILSNLDDINTDSLSLNTQFLTGHIITIKPETLFKYDKAGGNLGIKIYYSLSNADIDIYLDALKIAKENAYPKVSYEIDVSMWSKTLLRQLYTKLAQIVMINDTDLKLQDTFGYISQVELDLDHQEKDTVEVKNYKTKFEDLFSKIVAETEEMHKNSYNIEMAGALVAADSINQEKLDNTLSDEDNQNILKQYLDNYINNDNGAVKNLLSEMWAEAGTILASSSNSLNTLATINNANASILDGFRENVSSTLTPKVYSGETEPTSFKPGDVWINGDYYGVATGYSNNGGGFTRTYNGKLAQITGSSIDIDAESGIIDINAQTEINLSSGQDINIAANDTVNIIGNKEVNIGGTTINIASANIINGGTEEIGTGGIHLVATTYAYSAAPITEGIIDDRESQEETLETADEIIENYNDDATDATSRVDITGDGIEMASKNGIVIKSGAGIDIKSSNNENISAIQIDKNKGIWLGSDKGISLFSGTMGQNASAASIELNPAHLLLGVSSTSNANATVIEMTQEGMVIGAGSNLATIRSSTDINSLNVAGFKISSNYIGMATATATENNITTHSIVSISPTAVLIGSSQVQSGTPTGSYVSITTGGIITKSGTSQVSIAPEGITISTNANLFVSANNFTINTSATQNQTVFKVGGSDKYIQYLADGTLTLKLEETNLIIGNKTADQWVGTKVSITDDQIWAAISDAGDTTKLKMTADSLTIGSSGILKVSTSNVIINTDAGNNASIFRLRSGGDNSIDYFRIYNNSSGNIIAKLSGWTLTTNKIYSGSSSSYVALDSGTETTNGNTTTTEPYAIWCGATTSSNAPFRVKRDGSVYLTSLHIQDKDGNDTIVNLSGQNSTYPMWKLWYPVITNVSEDTITLSSGATINFNKAASVYLTSLQVTQVAVVGNQYLIYITVKLSNDKTYNETRTYSL